MAFNVVNSQHDFFADG